MKCLLVAVFCLFAFGAQAACPNSISAITVLESGTAVQVTLRDQVTCNPVAVTSITPTGGLACVANAVNLAAQSPTKVKATVSSTPPTLDFTTVSGATGMGACTVQLNHQDGSNTVGSQISVTLSDGVISVVPTTP